MKSRLSVAPRAAVLFVSAVVAAGGVSACGVLESEPPAAPVTITVTEPSADGAQAREEESAVEGDDSPVSDAAGAPTDPAGADTVALAALGLSDRHPNGVTLDVTSIRIEPTGILLGVRAINGYTESVLLNENYGGSQPRMFLLDDLGNGYNFRAPAQNDRLLIEPGAELSGTLVFLGAMPAEARTLTLKVNVKNADVVIDLSERGDWDLSPQMLIEDIPREI